MKTLRLFVVLFLSIVSSTKAKICSIQPEINSTVVKITGKDCTTFELKSCETTESIKELHFSRNRIEDLRPGMFTCFKKLKKLQLDNNLIRTIHQGTFSNLSVLEILNLKHNRISSVSQDTFKGLHSLNDLDLGYNSITEIKENAFSELKLLKNLKLNNNNLQRIADGAFDELKLTYLNLEFNQLEKLPVFRRSSEITILHISNNPIKILDAKTLGKYHELEILDLINTDITKIPNRVFTNSTKLHKLTLKGSKLTDIQQKAFEGTRLRILDLQSTQINYLPGDGLEGLKHLIIKGAKALWEIPIVSFERLEKADVEYPFHCCLIKSKSDSFKVVATLPSIQDTGPTKKICNKSGSTTARPTTVARTTTTDPFAIPKKPKGNGGISITLPPDACFDVGNVVTKPTETPGNVSCTPENDVFNPCGDLLGSYALRICSWFVLVFAILGNSFKLFVLLLSKRKISIAKILMCNLAFANLCMGIFLLMIASADLYSLNEYQNFAIQWQYRRGCKIAGFMSVFSTELAVFVLTVITVERYFTIVHPLKLNKHLNTKQIIVLMGLGWTFALTMAVLPFFEVSSYQKVAICLPFEVQSAVSKAYVTFLLATNGFAFLFVLFCYGRMYCSLGGSGPGTSVNRMESRVAKRMAMLVITNFACWFPIALVSLIAIYGKSLISVKAAQFFLIFVYPINSFTNPYLYAIGTKHFQIDALEILSRLGICNSAIDKLSNRLRDQLETLPNSSRITGSKISLSSVRSQHQSPGISPRNSSHAGSSRGNSYKSQNGSVKSNNNFRYRGSPRDGPSCSPCSNFLTIPLIHRKNYKLDKQQEITDSRFSLDNNVVTERHRSTLKDSDMELDKILARRVSAREVVLEGQILSNWSNAARRSITKTNREELMPLESVIRSDENQGADHEEGEDRKERKKADSPILQVPVVLVTTC